MKLKIFLAGLLVVFMTALIQAPVFAEKQPETGNSEKPKIAFFLDTVALNFITIFNEIPIEERPLDTTFYKSRAISDYVAANLDLTGYDFIIIDVHGGRKGIRTIKEMLPILEPAKNAGTQIALVDFAEKIHPATVCMTEHSDLRDYYANLGVGDNARNLLNYIYVEFFGGKATVEPPVLLPAPGIYHPDAPDIAFDNIEAYLEWSSNRIDHPFNPDNVTIGVLIHRGRIVAGDTAVYDALLRELESQGANVIMVYPQSSVDIERDGPKPDLDLFYKEDKLMVDAVISFQAHIAGVTFSERRDQFAALGVPVLGALQLRNSPEEWKNCPEGISLVEIGWQIFPREMRGSAANVPVGGITTHKETGVVLQVPMPEQIKRIAGMAIKQAKLSIKSNEDKKIAVIYFTHSPGKNEVGASFLNVMRSLERLLLGMYNDGYKVNPMTEEEIKNAIIAHGINVGQYAQQTLEDMVNNHPDQVILIPENEYNNWFKELPLHRQKEVIDFWGEPPGEVMVVERNGQKFIVLPAIRNGNVIIMPQPMRGGGSLDERVLYHSLSTPPTHQYIAFYYWLQKQDIDAIIHFGTHGTQEWLPGKARGLSATDCWPAILLGTTPVIYPYIVDNVGEATMAKRRGDATIISHMTPPLIRAGFYGDLLTLHEEIHKYKDALVEAAKEVHRQNIIDMVIEQSLHLDMEMTPEDFEHPDFDFEKFLQKLHDHIHELEHAAMPYGLHVLGDIPSNETLLEVLPLMTPLLQAEIIKVAGITGDDECEVIDQAIEKEKELLSLVLLDQACPVEAQKTVLGNSSSTLTDLLVEVKNNFQNFQNSKEIEAILNALSGRFILPSIGGDPIRSPGSLPTGRNLYSFDPRTVPTKAAWEVGKQTMQQLISEYKETHGEYPDKIAFNLWSIELMRHKGITESQILYAMGVEPVWDKRGRVRTDGGRIGVRLIPDEELDRPRIDVAVIMSGLYRDTFPCRALLIDQGVQLAAQHKGEKVINHVHDNSAVILEELLKKGIEPETARALSMARIFGPAAGNYGTGISNPISASGTWEDASAIADFYLDHNSSIYSSNFWGKKDRSLFETVLSGTDTAILSRTSNLYGVLTSDDPFEWLGGLSMAIEHIDGKPPELRISNLRNPVNPQIETLNHFLRRELRTTAYNPKWIEGMMEHGYSGAREMSDVAFHLFGWQVTTPHLITDDIWEEMFEIYVQDKYNLGLQEFFDKNNPWAQQSAMGRMIESIRKDYWEADKDTTEELLRSFMESVTKFKAACCCHICGNPSLSAFVTEQAYAMGMDQALIQDFNNNMNVDGDKTKVKITAETAQPPARQPEGIGVVGTEVATAEMVPEPTVEPVQEPVNEPVKEPAASQVQEVIAGEVMEVVEPGSTQLIDIDMPVFKIIAVILLMALIGLGYLLVVRKKGY
ncbi:cobaltochelatase subunit CobN [Peptococcaceae bacterium]|nr:cobaltochelatase subunit CobN [Peptococcaceae bacterium]